MKQFALIKAYLKDKALGEEERVIHREGQCIVINNPHLGSGTRIFLAVFAFPFFCIGLLGLYNGFHDLILNPRPDLETLNIILGITIIITFLGLSTAFFYAAIYPDKKLIIKPDDRQILLTLTYPFSVQKSKKFDFSSPIKLTINHDYRYSEDNSKTWFLEIRLPEKSKLKFWATHPLQDEQKARVEYWRDEINAILKS